MLTAVKGNREAKINSDQKEDYLKAGYDVIDEKGNRTIAPSSTVSHAEYEKLQKELTAAKSEAKKLKKELDALKKKEEEKKAGE